MNKTVGALVGGLLLITPFVAHAEGVTCEQVNAGMSSRNDETIKYWQERTGSGLIQLDKMMLTKGKSSISTGKPHPDLLNTLILNTLLSCFMYPDRDYEMTMVVIFHNAYQNVTGEDSFK